MSRLIDADKLKIGLIELYRGSGAIDFAIDVFMDLIDEQPTAYDVNEIVKTMKEYKEKADEVEHSNSWLDYMHRGYSNAMGFAIKLVKGGGVKVDVTDINVGSKWIPCSEKLPENQNKVLVTTTDNEVMVCYWSNISDYYYDGAWVVDNDDVEYELPKQRVVAWCELPKPYEGDDRIE